MASCLIAEQQLSKGQTSHTNTDEDIFFSLASSKSIHCYNCIITYDVSHVNSHAEAIDPAIGIFVAPVKANYFFQFHALVKEHKQAKVQVQWLRLRSSKYLNRFKIEKTFNSTKNLFTQFFDIVVSHQQRS